MISIETKRLHTYCIDSVSNDLNKTADISVGWTGQDYFPHSQVVVRTTRSCGDTPGSRFPWLQSVCGHSCGRCAGRCSSPGQAGQAGTAQPLQAGLAGRQGLLLGAADVEDQPDAQEEAAQHRTQLGDQVELHDLTQERVIGAGVGPELAETHKHNITLHCYSKINC